MIKRALLILGLLLVPLPLLGQTTAVTATITDSDGQAWFSGTFTITFVPTPGFGGQFQYNGAPMTNAQKGPYLGVMDGTGTFTVSLPDNSFITPSGTQWLFTLCSLTAAPCSAITTPVVGGALNLSALLSSKVAAPRFPANGSGFYGYSNTEINQIPKPGGQFYDVTVNCIKGWNPFTSSFSCMIGGGTPAAPLTSVQFNNGGTLGGDSSFTFNSTTKALSIPEVDNVLFVDGVKYTTIQAALVAVPAGGAEVHVPANSSATWGAGSTAIPANTKLIFDSAAATYVVPGPITLGAQSHLICAAGQSTGLSGQNNTGFPNAGTVLNFTGNLTGSQDAISATGNNNNDGVSVEGCYIKMGGSGRAGVHFSGINGSLFAHSVVADPINYGYWLDSGSTAGSHSYGNAVWQTDVIHSGSEAYRLSVDPAGTGVGGDIDRTTFVDAEQHPRDIGGVSSTGQGFHLLVPSTASASQTIANLVCINCISNGTANATYGMKLENARAASGASVIEEIYSVGLELEDVFQANTGTAFVISDLSSTDIAHIHVPSAGLVGPGYAIGTNISTSNVVDFELATGITTLPSNFPNQFDAVSFGNMSDTTSSLCKGGVRWFSGNGNYQWSPTNDALIHFQRIDGATTCTSGGNFADWMTWDQANKQVNLLSGTKLSVGGGTAINLIQAGSATLTYTLIAANTCQEQTLSVASAAAGKAAFFSPGASIGSGLSWSSWVSASGTVSVRVCNVTVAGITPSAVTWNGWVEQ